MATLTLRPTSATGDSWSNTANVYDGSTSTAGTVSVTSNNCENRFLTCNFDTSVIPSGATINSATLTVIAKQSATISSRKITPRVDINGDSNKRVIEQQLTSTSSTTLTADVSSYMSDLTFLAITPYSSTSRSGTFTLYEVYIDVDYSIKQTYTVTSSSNTGGSISPNGEIVVLENGSQSYSISTDTGYKIKDVLIDGVSQGAIASYTFTNVNSNHTIEVVFELVPTVVAAIEINKMHAIGLIEGEANMSLDINGLHIVEIYEDLTEGESIYLDENGILHVYEFLEDLTNVKI